MYALIGELSGPACVSVRERSHILDLPVDFPISLPYVNLFAPSSYSPFRRLLPVQSFVSNLLSILHLKVTSNSVFDWQPSSDPSFEGYLKLSLHYQPTFDRC